MINRKALCVGIDYYEKAKNLNCCVNDAEMVSEMLARNEDGSVNFAIQQILVSEQKKSINSKELKQSICKLFEGEEDVVLFYFSGHGNIDGDKSMLCCSDGSVLYLEDIMDIVSKSKVKNKIIILDSCFAGGIGDFNLITNSSLIPNGVSILTACSKNQTALESGKSGVFTKLFVEALKGGNADLLGNITVASVYSYIDLALGPWEQRPIFKTNVNNFVVLRKRNVPVSIDDIHKLVSLFETEDSSFKLNPTFEDTNKDCIKENVKKFKLLQKFNKLGVVVPEEEEYMYFAAVNSTSCKLTELGKQYWKLVKKERI